MLKVIRLFVIMMLWGCEVEKFLVIFRCFDVIVIVFVKRC